MWKNVILFKKLFYIRYVSYNNALSKQDIPFVHQAVFYSCTSFKIFLLLFSALNRVLMVLGLWIHFHWVLNAKLWGVVKESYHLAQIWAFVFHDWLNPALLLTTTNTTLPVTVVCYGAPLTVTLASTSVGSKRAQHDMVLPMQMILRDTMRDSFDTTSTSVSDAFPGILKLCHVFSTGEIFLSGLSLPLIHMSYVRVCLVSKFLLSGSREAAMLTNWGSPIWVCNTTTHCSVPLASIWSMAHTRSAPSAWFFCCFE